MKHRFAMMLICSFFKIVHLQAADDTLISVGAAWKYFDKGSDQGTDWRSISFNDSSWASGPSELGYGDGDEATVLSYGADANTKYITTYFRKTFSIPSLGNYRSVILKMVRDDGAVVYVNGTEAYRTNMPAGNINYSTAARTAISGVDESTWLMVNLQPSLFNSGTNVLAVEIHQNSGTSSDISFNLMLAGSAQPIPVKVKRGPYLQMLGQESVNIRWTTDVATNSRVQYGADTTYGFVIDSAQLSTEHEVRISGLQAETVYYYSVGSSIEKLQGDSKNYFKTSLPTITSSLLKVWVTGDFGTGTNSQKAVMNSYLRYAAKDKAADFWLWLGDNAYQSGTEPQYDSYVFSIYPEIMKNTPIYPCLGNHDYANAGYQSATALGKNFPYFNLFTCPENGEAGGVASMTEKYYSFNNGPAHFIVLDSYGALNAPGSPMYTWLENDLASNRQQWTICCWHHAPYTKGTHNSDTETELIDMRTNILPLLESYHVDLVLGGHSHVYERSYLMKGHYGTENTLTDSMKIDSTSGHSPFYLKSSEHNFEGTVYAVVGNSGQGGPVAVQSGWPHDAMFTSTASVFGSMLLDIGADTLSASFLTSTDSIWDDFKIVKNLITGERHTIIHEPEGTTEIYPNPFGDELFIKNVPAGDYPVKIELVDLSGRMVFETTFSEYEEVQSVFGSSGMAENLSGVMMIRLIAKSQVSNRLINRLR